MILYLLTWKEKTDVEKLDCSDCSDNATNSVDFETQMKRKTKTRTDCERLYSTGNLHAHSQDGLRG